MLTLIIIRDTASIPVGTAHTSPSSASEAPKAERPAPPTYRVIRALTMSRRTVWYPWDREPGAPMRTMSFVSLHRQSRSRNRSRDSPEK